MQSLKPEIVWHYFDQLRQIPRPSGKEQQVTEWLISIADKHNLAYRLDEVGNFCMHIPPSPGYEDSPAVILQAHSDMVTEKVAGSNFNFETDSIQIVEKDGWITAVDTTLGADNGIGLCLALAAATDPDCVHPALQILVTVQEETTFQGAMNLDAAMLGLTGTVLINLDNEEDGAVFVSSAGMVRLGAMANLQREGQIDESKSYLEISLQNLPGGHSGAQIDEEFRENAILALLNQLKSIPHKLISIKGGNKDNAIPRDATAVIQIEPDLALNLMQSELKTPQGYPFNFRLVTPEYPPITEDFVSILTSIQNGVISCHPSIPDLVQTSSNLASISTSDHLMGLRISIRSCLNQDLFEIYNLQSSLLHGFICQRDRITPGWNGDPNSWLVQLACDTYTEFTGLPASVKAIHAGLEVGEISSRLESHLNQKIDGISFGPTIEDAHSPAERVNIESTAKAYLHLKLLLSKIRGNTGD